MTTTRPTTADLPGAMERALCVIETFRLLGFDLADVEAHYQEGGTFAVTLRTVGPLIQIECGDIELSEANRKSTDAVVDHEIAQQIWLAAVRAYDGDDGDGYTDADKKALWERGELRTLGHAIVGTLKAQGVAIPAEKALLERTLN